MAFNTAGCLLKAWDFLTVKKDKLFYGAWYAKKSYLSSSKYFFYYSLLGQVWQDIFILQLYFFWPRHTLIPLNQRLSGLYTEGITLPRISRGDLKIRKLTQTVVFHRPRPRPRPPGSVLTRLSITVRLRAGCCIRSFGPALQFASSLPLVIQNFPSKDSHI